MSHERVRNVVRCRFDPIVIQLLNKDLSQLGVDQGWLLPPSLVNLYRLIMSLISSATWFGTNLT